MKKLLIILIAIIFITSAMFGCTGNKTEKNGQIDKKTEVVEKETDKTSGLGIELTDEEQRIYDKFLENYNDVFLRGLTPLTICRLYIFAWETDDCETEYELYITDTSNEWPTKEDYLKECESSDRQLEKMDTDLPTIPVVFKNATEGNVSYLGETEAIVRVAIKDIEGFENMEELKNYSNYIFTFHLYKEENGIWKVSWLPFQYKKQQ